MAIQTPNILLLASHYVPWLVFLIAVVFILGYIYQVRTTASNFGRVPPLGQLVDVGGYKLHLYCSGEGSGPTVVVDAGNGDFSIGWSGIQREVEKSARICTYDRAGYGWSDVSPHPRTAMQMAKELHDLLSNARVEPPYILVGHSLGGLNARMYASLYPQEVVGMILVDAGHEDQLERLPPEYLKLYQQQQTYFSVLAFLSRFGVLRVIGNASKGSGFAPPQVIKLPKDVQSIYMMMLSHPAYFDTTLAELRALPETAAEVRETGSLGNMPLLILSADTFDEAAIRSMGLGEDFPAAQIQHTFNDLQQKFEGLSTNSRRIVVKNSTHAIHLDQRQAVIKAIVDMITITNKGCVAR